MKVEQATSEKKEWIAPVLEELPVEQTLGGTVHQFLESQWNIPHTNRGSFPG